MIRIIICIIGVLVNVSARAELYPVTNYRLENGLEIIFATNEGAEVVSQVIFYKAGGMDESYGKSGVAHFLEHLMFRGPNKDFSGTIDRMGGDTNAYTSKDMTAYYVKTSSDNLAKIIEMEANRMTNLSFSEAEFVAEKSVVEQERVMRYDGSPRAQFMQKIDGIRWDRHPYKVPVIGYKEEFSDVSPKDIHDFYNDFYAPDNAVLVLSGNFDETKAKELIEKHYGKITKKSKDHKQNQLPKSVKFKISEHDNRINEDLLIMLYNPKPLSKDSNKNAYALMLIAEYLAGKGQNSVLYQKLVLDEEIASSVSVSYNGLARDSGNMMIAVSFKDRENRAEIEEIIFEELENIKTDGIDESELKVLKKVFIAGFIYAKEDLFATADLLGTSKIIGYDINTLEDELNALSNADIKLATIDLLKNYTEVIAYLYGENRD